MILHLLSPLCGRYKKKPAAPNQKLLGNTHTHTQCTVISFCFFCFSRGNHYHPLSSSSTNEREKNSTDTQQPGRLQTQMIDRPAEKEIRFKKERLSLWVTFRSDLFNGFFFYY
jgi:hypothetical protein